MTINELNPQDNLKSGPSLHVVREVIGLPEDFNIGMRQEIKSRPIIDKFDVDILLEPDSYVTIIGPDEVLNLHEVLGEELTTNTLDDLVDSLKTQLPSRNTDKMTIQLRPLDKRRGRETGDRGLGQARIVEYCNFRAPSHQRLEQERQLAKEVLYEFFEADRGLFGLDDEDIWSDPSSSDIGRLLIGSATGLSNIGNMTRLLTETRVLPLGVTLGPLIVEKVQH